MNSYNSISGKTRVVGVWGHPVAHSRSPLMHNAALRALGRDWVYVPFDIDPERIQAAVDGIRAMNLVGVNVTVPLKEGIIPYLDVVDEEARRIGSVNTIHNINGVLHGYSTDGPGFIRALEALDWPTSGQKVGLLGAGGSARAVAYALAARGNQVVISNRTRERAESLADVINQYFPNAAVVKGWEQVTGGIDMIINATSLGMHPREDAMPPLTHAMLGKVRFVYDLIYAPPETKLLRTARDSGCTTANGLGMLVQQGALSLAIWLGETIDAIPVSLMEQSVC